MNKEEEKRKLSGWEMFRIYGEIDGCFKKIEIEG